MSRRRSAEWSHWSVSPIVVDQQNTGNSRWSMTTCAVWNGRHRSQRNLRSAASSFPAGGLRSHRERLADKRPGPRRERGPDRSKYRFKRYIAHLYYLGHPTTPIIWRCVSSTLPGCSRAILEMFLDFTMTEQIKMAKSWFEKGRAVAHEAKFGFGGSGSPGLSPSAPPRTPPNHRR